MNIWSEILDMLAKDKQLSELIIAPNAPPLSRTRGTCQVVSGKVFTAGDVEETLGGVVMRTLGKRPDHLPQAGVLCVGVREVGRLRICYFTQRGSRVLRIVRIPLEVPALATTCADPAQALEIVKAIGVRKYRAVLIYGTSPYVNCQAAYALMSEINNTYRQVIYIVEPTLSFLLPHHNSLVVQVELTTDVPTRLEAINHAFLLEPSVVHLGDIRVTEDLKSLRPLFLADVCTLMTTLTDDPAPIIDRLPVLPAATPDMPAPGVALKTWAESDGKIRFEAKSWSWAEKPS